MTGAKVIKTQIGDRRQTINTIILRSLKWT
jgi:hypothetical protein